MQPWEAALRRFLMDWKDRDDVIGAMVCGSYVTGNPTNRSDLDIHVILSDKVDWRERGNLVVEGILVEYFANPPKQIRKYFAEDYECRSTMSMVQFLTGRVVWDHEGVLAELKQEASVWIEKPYDELPIVTQEFKKYGLWDTYDNLMDGYETGRQDFPFLYHHALGRLFQEYASFLRLENIPTDQIFRYLTETEYLEKYCKSAFPDERFRESFIAAMTLEKTNEMIEAYQSLYQHVWNAIGGFEIDGWRIRTPLDV